MASAKRDFENFVRWLHLPVNEVPSNVRRLANSVLENFDTVQATSRQRNQRSGLLAGLAQHHLLQTADTLPEIAQSTADGAWLWRRLRHLTVGPFRGFRRPEPFDLQKRIILFYGPNGSGKTSLCEALEYSLLGSVEEAEIKRIDIATYLSNIHERRFADPVLRATDLQGEDINVTINADAYRFCFIEKNRIDSFSRIAARPTAQRTELIATLFGMEKFNEFVSHFNESMDGQLTLTNTKGVLLAARRAVLAQDQATVSSEATSLRTLDEEDMALAQAYSEGITYEGLKTLIGSAEAPSRLQQLNDILNAVPPQIFNVTRQGLQELYENANGAQDELITLTATLEGRANQVSFKDLYTAVIALQTTEGDHCPACDTPLDGPIHVLNNPYEKATRGLEQLRELAELQDKKVQVLDKVAQISRNMKSKLETLHQFVTSIEEEGTLVGRYLAALPEVVTGDWWTSIYENNANPERELPTLENILDVAHRIETQDNASRLAHEERQRNIEERDRLIEYQLLIQAQDNRRQTFIESVTSARLRIGAFEEANAGLIEEAAQERIHIDQDTPIKTAYDLFLSLLRRYLNRLPGTLMAGLNDRAMMLFNEFNRKDLEADKLAALYLPLSGEQKIEISFRGNPQARVDALKVLSEGHIRCLGLAILLAKNLSLQSPLIVFDDAINAIDHDHRRGIRETIFESDHFASTQIITTCHSHEFIKDIQQSLPRPVRNDSKVYLFRNHDGSYHPRVNGNVPSRNYVEMARAAREELNDRGALDASRKALEMLTEKVWRWLGSHEHGTIKVLLTASGTEPTLRNLCEALRKKIISEQTFVHANKQPIIVALERVLGIPEQNLVWIYLNKGTHEEADRDDFDGDEVESVIVTLEELEALDLRLER
ncbi:MAG: AAA family ATPase [Deltaproteobacteria bacterium]|nr:AAA family ATPase [Deltaproteobacteria bacterium]